MSQDVLSRLIVRKKYLLPMKPSDIEISIEGALVNDDPGLDECPAWFVDYRSENCLVFKQNTVCTFLRFKRAKPKDAAKLSKKFHEDVKLYFDTLKRTRSAIPYELSVYFSKANDSGCIADVTLKPTLYQKIVQLHVVASDVDVQDSYLLSGEFMRKIFEGGLSGTLISEDKPTVQKAPYELLINDSHLRQISERVNKMLDAAKNEVLITGWIGTILLQKFAELRKKGVRISIVTGNISQVRQDAMQKEKEKAMKELISMLGKSNISLRADIHGRMVIVDNDALIGSMDMDSYSLTGARFEFAMYTEEPTIVTTLRKYFNSIFSPMEKVGDQKKQESG